MSLVPDNPNFAAAVPEHAAIPSATMPNPPLPPDMDLFEDSKKKSVRSLLALAAQNQIMCEQHAQQYKRVEDRCSSEQWLDENEREWYAMDEMLRSRPWAQRRDKPFPYPFREVTHAMREVEGPWLGDSFDPPHRPFTRSDAPCDVLVHLRPVAEHPPLRRVILFTPEFGSDKSFSAPSWRKLLPMDTCDLWIVSWQGWSNFEEMIEQVLHKVLSFADATSTVWFAHSMGAIVAYETLKRFEMHHSPNLPVALIVSGCPAPHNFEEQYRPQEKYSWLAKLETEADFALLTPEQHEILAREFQVNYTHEVDPMTVLALQLGLAPPLVREKFSTPAALTSAQKLAIINDQKVISSYRFRHDPDSKAVVVPVVALCHDEDMLVPPSAVESWQEYTRPGVEFDFVALEDIADGEELAKQGHGFTKSPVPELLERLQSVCAKYQLVKEVDDILPGFGPTDGEIPAEIDCLVVGAGIAGITQAKALVETGKSVLIVDRYRTIGGIWMFYANNFSRVNSSEPAYRIVNQEGIGSRPNEDHSPRHDILRDIFTVANKFLWGKIRCNKNVTKVQKRADGTWDVTVADTQTGQITSTHAKIVSFHVNRRIGRRRDLTWPNAKSFRGEEVYGYANEVTGLNFWRKRVIVVGAGAFAFENLRTALEHGAKHCTILGRRAGTTCPKWIDMIAFLRPLDPYFNTNKNGNIISFDAWRKCYEDAGLKTPECWEEGLLKPHNHTVSVSDLAFIGGYHGMVDLRVGEIDRFTDDGQGVHLKDGSRIDAEIIIKATGFHLNEEVSQITGYKHIHSFGLLDYNLNYGAEALLDGGQFGSAKGKMAGYDTEQVDQMSIYMGMQEMSKIGLPDITPRANPFGSAYVGGMLSSAYNFKWLVEHEEYQKDLLETVGKPVQSATETWVSQIGSNSIRTINRLLASLH
mmetsp:Transcript_126023/g.351154  ORF Transcript_126023/g.351154 Transcript_126023/m.351154 type:complete len:923 (-) Transcript_126023:115-2883(-)